MSTNLQEPQQIGNLSERAFAEITSRPSSSNLRVYETQEEADAAYAEHLAAIGRRTRMESAKYPKRHIDTLEGMHGASLAKAVELWGRVRSGGIIFLIGDRGPGKTQMATWFASELLKVNRSCGRYVKLADLFNELKATWGGRGDKAESEVLSKYFQAKFLVLDEAQERGNGDNDRDWCDRTLSNLIDHRYDAMLPTVMCANYTLQQYEANVPGAIRSRIVEAGGVILCDWPSYRH